jgi:hypothetical protein
MANILKYPPFGSFLSALHAAGVSTGTARGFWGGVTEDGEIVVTAWTDKIDGPGRFIVSRPQTNHGGLKTAREVRNIRVGTEVTLILIRQRGNKQHGRTVDKAASMPGKWRVVKIANDSTISSHGHAIIEQVPPFSLASNAITTKEVA